MKFAPLEFVTNTFAGPSGGELEASETPTNDTAAAAATTRRTSRRSSRTRSSSSNAEDNDVSNNSNDGDDDDESFAASPSKNVRFDVPSSDDSEPEQELELTNNSSQFFVLRKETNSASRSSERNKDVVSPPKTIGVDKSSPSTTNPNTAKTPSPGKSLAKKISPTSDAALVTTPSNKNSNINAITPSGKKPRKQSSKQNTGNEKEKESIPEQETTSTAAVSQQQPKKKRLNVYEQLTHDANASADQWKEDADEGLRFKRKIHKEKLREIRETEDQMQQLQQKLEKLKSAAGELETLIQKDMETKKRALKLGNILKKTASRAAKKALKEKDDFKTNLKAKDTLLKEAKKDIKKELQNMKRSRVDSDSDDDDLEVVNRKNKKKRKVSPASKRPTTKSSESSDERDSDASDASDSDDSDWEGASKRRSNNKKAKKHADHEQESSPSDSSPRRQTRVRSSKWNCQRCTLENEMQDHECVACGSTRPGYIPDF